MKYFYIAVTVEENSKCYSYAVKVSESDNLLSKLAIKGLLHANLCQTKKRAQEVVDFWNTIHRKNGCFMFDSPTF